MALTDGESAVLRDIAVALTREDPRLVSSLRSFTPPRTCEAVVLALLLALALGLLALAVWLHDPAALVLGVTLLVVLPVGGWLARRRRWL